MIILDTNLENKATSQYVLDINSLVKFNGSFFCASSNGLFQFSRDNDNGSAISSYFELPTMDFGLPNEKRLRYAYIGYEATSAITMTVSTENSLSDTYILPATTDLQSGYRVAISRKLYGRYFTFKFAGAGFAIDHVAVLPIVRGHNF
jgi:hypothetical protein